MVQTSRFSSLLILESDFELTMTRATNRIRRQVVFVGALLLLVVLSLAGSRNAIAAEQSEDLYRLFHVDLPPADVVILLDASRSMNDHQYGDVRQAVVDFAPTLTGKETLQLRVFGDTVGSPLEGRGEEVAPSVAGYLPSDPFFGHTDLGLAILKALEFLDREGSSRVQALFVITDGLHDPPGDSPYSHDFNDPNWRALQQRAQALCARQKVLVYGFGLGRQTDIAVLRKVFPTQNVELVVGGAAHVAYALQRIRERLSQTQLRQAVEQELSEGRVEARLDLSAISGDVPTFNIPLTIRNTYSHLSIVVEQIKIQRPASSGMEVSCEVQGAPKKFSIAPGKEWRGVVTGSLNSNQPRWHVGKTEKNYSSSFEFITLVRFQDEAALADLGLLEATPTIPGTPVLKVDLRVSYGISYWTILLIGSTALGCAAGLAQLRRHLKHQLVQVQQRQEDRRRIAGKLKTWQANEGEPEGDGADLGIFAAAEVRIVKTEDGNLDLASPADGSKELVVARVFAELVGASPRDGESGRVEFTIKPTDAHRLQYEAGSDWPEAIELTLCDNDVLSIDAQWRLRYVNNRLRTRAEVEAAQGDDLYV
jgi:von Willebrand factor type A domain